MKNFFAVMLMLLLGITIHAQDIKLFDSYLRTDDLDTRYVVVLSDNTIWWFAPGNDWQKSSMVGLP